MDSDIRDKWIRALRSGKYEQANMVLLDRDGRYCCLGVLCVVAGAHLHADEGLAFPERKTLEAIGVGPDCGGHHPFWKLAEMNDKGKSFAEIADYIEQRF